MSINLEEKKKKKSYANSPSVPLGITTATNKQKQNKLCGGEVNHRVL